MSNLTSRIKNFLRPLKRFQEQKFKNLKNKTFSLLPEETIDYVLDRKVWVSLNGNRFFSIRNMGFISRKRAETFYRKEPDTIGWIDGFGPDSTMVDIGANIGIYSLYAAKCGHKVIAFEPQALNFACLTVNIMDNQLGGKIKAYPFCAHEKVTISDLNLLDGSTWGSANSSFERTLSSMGQEIKFYYGHGSVGISIDFLVEHLGISPDIIKIDVDGNELLVLKGAIKTLNNQTLKTILVELSPNHPEYGDCIKILSEAGFKIHQTGESHKTLANYIFNRI